jgi:hypothetical protein
MKYLGLLRGISNWNGRAEGTFPTRFREHRDLATIRLSKAFRPSRMPRST